MVEPQYQELLSKDIPHVVKDGVHVTVIAGTSYGASVSVAQQTAGSQYLIDMSFVECSTADCWIPVLYRYVLCSLSQRFVLEHRQFTWTSS